MSQSSTPPEYSSVYEKVRNWSPAERLVLAQDILQSLERELGVRRRQKSLKILLGLLNTENRAPSDEECRKIVEDELLRKHG